MKLKTRIIIGFGMSILVPLLLFSASLYGLSHTKLAQQEKNSSEVVYDTVAGFVGHGAALDKARDLEIFVKTHGIRLLFGKVRDQRGSTNSNGGASRRRFDDERA